MSYKNIPTDALTYKSLSNNFFHDELKDEPLIYTRKSKDKRTLSELVWDLIIIRAETYIEVESRFENQCSANRARSREDLFKVLQARFPLMTFDFVDGL